MKTALSLEPWRARWWTAARGGRAGTRHGGQQGVAAAKVQTIPLKLDGVRVVLTRKHMLVLSRCWCLHG